jgi:hypothetical protein
MKVNGQRPMDIIDLLEKIQWAQANDLEAKAIARNAREFAVEHISESNNLIYLLYRIDEIRVVLNM